MVCVAPFSLMRSASAASSRPASRTPSCLATSCLIVCGVCGVWLWGGGCVVWWVLMDEWANGRMGEWTVQPKLTRTRICDPPWPRPHPSKRPPGPSSRGGAAPAPPPAPCSFAATSCVIGVCILELRGRLVRFRCVWKGGSGTFENSHRCTKYVHTEAGAHTR